MLGRRQWVGAPGVAAAGPLAARSRVIVASQAAAAFAAWLGVSFAVPLKYVAGLSPTQVRGLELSAFALLLVGLLLGLARNASDPLASRLASGLERVWFAGLPLALLPACSELERVIPPLVSVLLSVRFVPAGSFSRLPSSRAWQRALLGFASCFVVAFFAVGRTSPGSNDNDAAYYFGVARHMVRTHHWQEPIVWQFLTHASALTHAPFDYWHGFVALVLVPVMALFGCTHLVAGSVMGLVSGGSVVLFAYLIVVAAPLRNAGLQVLAIVLFACSPAMSVYRFAVETVPFVHVWVLASLIALARRRLAWATAFACCTFLSRADAATLSALLCAAAAYFALGSAAPVRALTRVSATAAAFASVYVGYHWLVFRSLGPPGAMLAPRLVDGTSLYYWLDRPATWTLAQRIAPQFVADRVMVALDTLQRVNFFPYYPVWLGCCLISALPASSPRQGLDGVCRCVLFAGAAGVALASPAVFASWRSLHTLLPVFVAAGAYGADRGLDALGRCVAQLTGRFRLSQLSMSLVTLWLALGLLRPLQLTAEPPPAPAFAQDFAALEGKLAGEPVMSNSSWFVLAYTRAPSVQLPFNGEPAMGAVLRRYGVKWLLIVNGENTLGSADIVNAVLTGSRTDVDGVHLTLSQRTAATTLFRVGS